MTTSGLTKRFANRCRNYLQDSGGNLTMLFGLAAIPVIAGAGMAIDYARISRVHDEIQLIADGATLAAAGAKNLSGTSEEKKTQRVTIATSYLTRGLAEVTDVDVIGTPAVEATTTIVKVSVNASVKGSLINVLDAVKQDAEVDYGDGGDEEGKVGGRTYDMVVRSEATWVAGVNYICMLALNLTQAEALHVKGTADIKANNCSIWDNSSSSSGLYQNGDATMTAKSISVAGNYYGSNYSPTPKHGVDPFTDPLATKFGTDYTAALAEATELYKSKTQMTFAAGESTMSPGLYDGGVKVMNNRVVTMEPGIYFIKDGEFEIQAGGIVKALGGVTIVLTGDNSTRINVQAGGSLEIKAPATGYFARLAIAQHPTSLPTAAKENSIIGGGTVNMTGIIYFPKQRLNVTGNGDISVTSDYFAMVADRIYIEGNGQLNIGQAADFDSAGLPALPSTGSGEAKVTLK